MPERYILIKMQQWRSIDLIHVIGVFQAVEDLFFRKFMSFVFLVNFSVNSLKLIFNYFFSNYSALLSALESFQLFLIRCACCLE